MALTTRSLMFLRQSFASLYVNYLNYQIKFFLLSQEWGEQQPWELYDVRREPIEVARKIITNEAFELVAPGELWTLAHITAYPFLKTLVRSLVAFDSQSLISEIKNKKSLRVISWRTMKNPFSFHSTLRLFTVNCVSENRERLLTVTVFFLAVLFVSFFMFLSDSTSPQRHTTDTI